MPENVTEMQDDSNVAYVNAHVDASSFWASTDGYFGDYGCYSIFENSPPQVLSPPGQPPYFGQTSASYAGQPQNFTPLNDGRDMMAPPMGLPPKTRKRKAPTLHESDWEPYKARIIELHIEQHPPLSLGEVRDAINEEFGFLAEVRQYRTCITNWGLDKNIKPKEMKAVVKKQQRRKLVDTDRRDLEFTIRGKTVDPAKIVRYMKRKKIPEDCLFSPSSAASTPSAVHCRTISSPGSEAPSPMYWTGTPNASVGDAASIAQSPQIFSPALSISSIVRPEIDLFTGQSPAAFCQDSTSGPAHVDSARYPYMKAEEEKLRLELSEAETLNGIDSSEALRILFELGCLLINQGRYRSAEKLIRKLVTAYQNLPYNTNSKALNLLGVVLHRQGLYSEAEKLLRRTLESKRAKKGYGSSSGLTLTSEGQALWREYMEDLETLSNMECLAQVLRDQGKYDAAEEMGRRALDGIEKVLGKDHPSTLDSLGNMAIVLRNQGKYEAVEEMSRRVLDGKEKILGKDHPSTLTTLGNMAIVLRNQGKFEAAEEMSRRALYGKEKILGKDHPNTLLSVCFLASLLRDRKEYRSAAELYLRAYKGLQKVLGPDHPNTVKCRRQYSRLLEAQEKLDPVCVEQDSALD